MITIASWDQVPKDAARGRARRRPTLHSVAWHPDAVLVHSPGHGWLVNQPSDPLIRAINGDLYTLWRSEYDAAYEDEPGDTQPGSVLLYDADTARLIRAISREEFDTRVLPALGAK